MRVLVIGQSGQVALALEACRPAGIEAVFLPRSSFDLEAPPSDIAGVVRGFDFVINAAAYTAVEKAESEPLVARTVNAVTPGLLAAACAAEGVPFFHYSTDYVFPGGGETPWRESDAKGPLNVYGSSKSEGEDLIRRAGGSHFILRICWVFSHEGKNFVKTMLRLGATTAAPSIVDDQFGSPTSAESIARATWAMMERSRASTFSDWGLYHFASEGYVSWHGFAVEIFAQARALGFPLIVESVGGVSTASRPSPVVRPLNSRLSTEKFRRVFGVVPPRWQDSLASVLGLLRG